MGNYKVYLDDVEFNDIDDVDELEIEFERDIKEKGFFVKYSKKLTFQKTAYTYLASKEPCDKVEIRVEYDCNQSGDYTEVINGFIIIKEVEFNPYKCKAEANIEDNSVSAIFFNAKNQEVLLDNDLQPLRNFFDVEGTLLTQTNGVDYAAGITVFNAFDVILDSISTGEIRLRSDFFSTAHQNYKNTIVLTSLTIGETITITWADEYGNTYTYNAQYQTATSPDDNYKEKTVNAIYELFGNNVYVNTTITGSASFEIEIEYHGHKLEIVDVVSTGAAGVNWFTDPYVEGMGSLYVTNGHKLSNREYETFMLSFDQLYEVVNNMFDLSFAFEIDAGQTYLRIEPIEYFFDNAVMLEVESADVTARTFYADRIAGAVRIGRGDNTNNKYTFKNLSCGDIIDRAFRSNVRVLGDEIERQITDARDYGDDLFFIEGKGLGGAFDEPKQYTRHFYFLGLPSFIYTYNEIISGGYFIVSPTTYLLRYHLFFLPDAVLWDVENKTINNTYAITHTNITDSIGQGLQYIYNEKFSCALRFSQFLQLNEYSMIQYNGDSYGYIDNLKFKMKGGKTEFDLLVR